MDLRVEEIVRTCGECPKRILGRCTEAKEETFVTKSQEACHWARNVMKLTRV